ncbi:MAG: L-2-amino-thiazoline-4-carboxylic acid hydrolase [Clostridia bacterium]|nr:L-2-amino-thiazoline-4-carboxylic acid hydrolase [Eubacterium sp.]MBR2559157.1 L-2-amino-thiazoline-4-carboxylic acid hydrolase [Bacillota bacterium]MCR4668193.1 L-2-amino-thiazoline-4-carboxylic acid hydrolase [Clostridia bacterium]
MAKEIINNATLHNYGVDGMREISERRAATIANIIDEGAKYGLSDQFVYDAIAKYGKDNADAMRAGMKEPDSFREFADTFGTDHNKDIYEMEIIEKTDDKLSIDFHYCPYVAQWEKQGHTQEEISRLCYVTMAGDHAFAHAFPCMDFELAGTIADGDGVCKLRFTKK